MKFNLGEYNGIIYNLVHGRSCTMYLALNFL